jgi:hypothetical protein
MKVGEAINILKQGADSELTTYLALMYAVHQVSIGYENVTT